MTEPSASAGPPGGSAGGNPASNNNQNSGNDNGSNRDNSRRNNNRRGNKSKSPTPTGHKNNNRNRNRNNNSKSPKRNNGGNNSRSPMRNNRNNKSKSPVRGNNRQRNKQPNGSSPPAAMTVICNRCDLWDSAAQFQPDEWVSPNTQHPCVYVNPYWFAPAFPHGPPSVKGVQKPTSPRSVLVTRVPYQLEHVQFPIQSSSNGVVIDVIDNVTPNPYNSNEVHDKYWNQRRRLFSKFDQGIQLDCEGWYSVTPELIADHVAKRVADLAQQFLAQQQQMTMMMPSSMPPPQQPEGIVIMDAFTGCGGNSIAFGKIPSHLVSKVVCVDTDRSKLLKAAHNASLYDIPKDKLVFVECNSIFILKYCYKHGEFILDQPTTQLPQYMPPPVMPTTHAGYQIGGLDLLPRRIDLAFFDPPWGGVDYEVLGKNGYDLEKNMKIQVSPAPPEDSYECDGDGADDFFDTFTAPKQHHTSKNARKKNFNKKTDGEWVNGKELIKLAADATTSRVVLFDLPRNTSKTSLGVAALFAGFRGNIKLEEHYLNGRLKTVTAYMGSDYSGLINDSKIGVNDAALSGDED